MSINRFSLLIALTVIAALAVLTISMVTGPRHPSASREYDQVEFDRAARYQDAAAQQAYLDQRRGEQTTAKYIDAQQVLQEFRHSEQTTGHIYNAQQAFLTYREGEWNAGVTPAQADLIYRRGEWTGK